MRVFPEWLTLDLVMLALVPFVGGILSAYSELFLGKKRSKARWKRRLIVLGSLMSIVEALLGAVLQGRDSYTLWADSTGAKEYCYVAYGYPTNNALRFMLTHDGEYPLFDVSVQIKDHNVSMQLGGSRPGQAIVLTQKDPPSAFEHFAEIENKTTVSFPVGNVRPRDVRYLWDAPIPKDDLQTYYVSIMARNGFVEEEILVRKTDGGSFVSALRIWKSTGNIVKGWPMSKIVKEDVPDNFRHFYPSGVPWTLDPNNGNRE